MLIRPHSTPRRMTKDEDVISTSSACPPAVPSAGETTDRPAPIGPGLPRPPSPGDPETLRAHGVHHPPGGDPLRSSWTPLVGGQKSPARRAVRGIAIDGY